MLFLNKDNLDKTKWRDNFKTIVKIDENCPFFPWQLVNVIEGTQSEPFRQRHTIRQLSKWVKYTLLHIKFQNNFNFYR